MGAYIYITEEDRIQMRTVTDSDVNEALQDALRFVPSLMIFERDDFVKESWFKKRKIYKSFTVFHEQFMSDGTPSHQARYQSSGSGRKEVTIAYLHGIINGYHRCKKFKE